MLAGYAQQYRRLWNEHWWWQSRTRFVLGHVGRIAQLQPLRRILDIGCGDGLMFDHLVPYGDVRGIEPDASLIDPNNPHRDRITVCPFDDDYHDDRRYDLILMLDVLEHIDDDLAAMRHLRRLLSPGGHAVLTVPALQMLWSQHDVVNRHYRRYTRRQFGDRLREAGLRLERIGYYFGWTVVPMLLRRLIAPPAADDAPTDGYTVSIPAQPINCLLQAVTGIEHRIASWRGLPIGSSVFAIVVGARD